MTTAEKIRRIQNAQPYLIAASAYDGLNLAQLLIKIPDTVMHMLAALNDVPVEDVRNQPFADTLRQLSDPGVVEAFEFGQYLAEGRGPSRKTN